MNYESPLSEVISLSAEKCVMSDGPNPGKGGTNTLGGNNERLDYEDLP